MCQLFGMPREYGHVRPRFAGACRRGPERPRSKENLRFRGVPVDHPAPAGPVAGPRFKGLWAAKREGWPRQR